MPYLSVKWHLSSGLDSSIKSPLSVKWLSKFWSLVERDIKTQRENFFMIKINNFYIFNIFRKWAEYLTLMPTRARPQPVYHVEVTCLPPPKKKIIYLYSFTLWKLRNIKQRSILWRILEYKSKSCIKLTFLDEISKKINIICGKFPLRWPAVK